jgi:stage II sporulation protein AA (anti-sigma F factor antagonist)
MLPVHRQTRKPFHVSVDRLGEEGQGGNDDAGDAPPSREVSMLEGDMRFSCTTRRTAGHLVIALAGDIDLAIYSRLNADAETWVDKQIDLVLDCSGVTFMDSMGLRVLVYLKRAVTEAGHNLTLADPSQPVTRVLELAGVQELFARDRRSARAA